MCRRKRGKDTTCRLRFPPIFESLLSSRLLILPLAVVLLAILIQSADASSTTRQLETPRFLTKKSCRFQGDGCGCVIRERGECCCRGRDVNYLPTNLTQSIRVLVMYNISLETITGDFFVNYPNLEEIEIFASPNLRYFDATALDSLKNLRKFSLTWCKKLEEISGTLIENNLKMQTLILRDNGLKRMPGLVMTDDHNLEIEVDLSGNEIQYIGDGRVKGVRARSLRLNHNRIKEIAGYAFSGSSFVKLYLNNNPELTDLSTDCFRGVSELHHLYLSDTSIKELPINGLKNLKSLSLTNVPTLKRLPSVLSFTQLKTAHFTYPHHCCLFKHVDNVIKSEDGTYKQNIKEIHTRMCKEQENKNVRKKRRKPREIPINSNTFDIPQSWYPYFSDSWFPDTQPAEESDYEEELPEFPPDMIGASKCLSEGRDTSVRTYLLNITCTPQPDALNPCENIVGYPLLRKAIWFVWVMAILGNILVWISLLLAFEKRMRVHYLFMINLSIADLLTGVYLGILAIQDVRTSNEYYRHAVAWQTGWGCHTAGFLAVFASLLSIISMFLIAFEMAYNTRMGFYGRRFNFKKAFLVLAVGWVYAFIVASLPIFGVSSYSTTSICLPLRADTTTDKIFLISGLSFIFLAFTGMAVSYVFIIMMLKDPSTPSREEDKSVIIKMALLIFTDFICWFPTILIGTTAALGYPLISISNAKIFLVFFFPLNSCANPILYVFYTEVIRRKVRTKTLPVLRRITSTPGIAFNSLSNFYNSQPPCSPTRLQITQMTSINSTPRGSKCSITKTIDSTDTIEIPTKRNSSSPRVSFQDDMPSNQGHRDSSDKSRRTHGLLKRVSAIPEVSDLSEHSSESHHEHIPSQFRDDDDKVPSQRLLNRIRHESAKSFGQDSGRGSITSTGTRDTERHSVASGVADSDGECSQLIPKIITPEPADNKIRFHLSEPKTRKLSPMPQRFHRKSGSLQFKTPKFKFTDCS